MPNWCSNELVVLSKDETKVKKLYEIFVVKSGEEGVFDKILPTPKELLEAGSPIMDSEKAEEFKKLYGDVDWYWWRVNNWGTKWDIKEVNSEHEVYSNGDLWMFNCFFDTAWSPPEQIIRKISEIYQDVYFHMEYKEEGMGFQGYASFLNGEDKGSVTVDSYPKVDDILAMPDYYYEIFVDQE